MLKIIKKHCNSIYIGLVLILSLLVYLPYYGQPDALFWDENYHIASAQKYIDGVMYMEPHPPLGKLLMAGSEAILGLNGEFDKSSFTRTDYVKGEQVPSGFSYYGYRLPSTLLMALSVLFFYGVVKRISRNTHLAAAFSCVYILDNAMVIHSRSAMLEGIQMFFILGAIYWLARSIEKAKKILLRDYAILGIFIGLAFSVKVNAAVLLLLFVMLYGVDQWENIKRWNFTALLKRLAVTVPSGVIPLVLVVLAVFYVHIGLGTSMGSKNYSASKEYQQLIKEGKTFSPAAFVVGLRDNYINMSKYADGVPRLDVCKAGENGSSAIGWPIGNKTINYRWNKNTIDGVVQVQYHNIVPNPVVWFSVVAGLILSVGLMISHFIYRNPVAQPKLFYWITAFTSLYISYMIAILQIERVMYLYHYLVPLVFGIINLSLVYQYIFYQPLAQGNRHALANLAAFVGLVAFVFYIFSPFTYSLPITEAEFNLRNWFTFWKLELVR
ncbi:phospholipid carrier-dependent glycosyltransferase [Teredinibacter haidensis]|uniref:phospholipid carrier-dependent glycosyltransferase n=1 Tax=Teredinibacter haidensis TaxID=2731755 RepID=UPI000948C56A|nr:phospholipid carrier-dependent glycosyltransferase [Teredinibacter haidensis]